MKSKGGLTRHTRTKHVSNNNSPQNQILEETLQISEVQDLMKQESLYKNKCYPEDIRLKIKDHTFKVNTIKCKIFTRSLKNLEMPKIFISTTIQILY